jgi:hypothetical protein
MKGLIRVTRRAVLARLKAHAGLLALVPAAEIHGQAPLTTPTMPFVKTGAPSATPLKAACLDGATVSPPVHAFARARKNGSGQVVETAEDHASRIGAEIEKALDDKADFVSIDAPNDVRLRYRLSDQQLLVDGADSDAFHWFATVQARVVAA